MSRLKILKRSSQEQTIADDGMGIFLYHVDGELVPRNVTDAANPVSEFFVMLNTLLIPDPGNVSRYGKWTFSPAMAAVPAEVPEGDRYIRSGTVGMFTYTLYFPGMNYTGDLNALYILDEGNYVRVSTLGLAPAQPAQAAKFKEFVSGFELESSQIGFNLTVLGEPITDYSPNEIIDRIKILKIRYDGRNGNTVEDIL
jgi:hypothetical protein